MVGRGLHFGQDAFALPRAEAPAPVLDLLQQVANGVQVGIAQLQSSAGERDPSPRDAVVVEQYVFAVGQGHGLWLGQTVAGLILAQITKRDGRPPAMCHTLLQPQGPPAEPSWDVRQSRTSRKAPETLSPH